MTVQELIKLIGEPKNKMLKVEQLQEIIKKKLDVKSYISIKAKKELIDSIVNECILYEDGVFKFDDIDKYICFTMRIIEAYTDLQLSDDIEDDYDFLCESGLLDTIINTFKKEYDDVGILLQMKCDYILSGNTIEAQFGKFFDGISEKLDDVARVLLDKVNGFDINNLPIGIDDLQKVLQFVNSQK